jgi:succinate dehydrogenase cytochrome b subunit
VTAQGSFLHRHHFLLRRLHSLSGIMPIGFFLLAHLTTNASVVWGMLNGEEFGDVHAGAATFQHEVNFIHSMPFLLLIEIFGLWLPIAFHAILGVYYARSSSPNVTHYAYRDNWRYTLQRISGYIGVLFIFYHVATLRWEWTFLVPGGTEWSAEFAASTMAAIMQGSAEGYTLAGFGISAIYLIGVSLLVFHMANGLWTAGITWGLTVTQASQKRWGYVCFALGTGLMALAWSAVIGFATLDYQEARDTELQLQAPHTETNANLEPGSASALILEEH